VPHHQIPSNSGTPIAANIQRSSLAKTGALHRSHAHGLVNIDGHEPRYAGFMHGDAD
jgi:hypothetical protein